MDILLDSNSLGQFIGLEFERTSTCVYLSDGSICTSLNENNTTVVNTDAPSPPLGGVWKWQNSTWVCVDQAAVDQYNAQQTVDFNASQSKKRHATYIAESDPIFFKWQRNEATQQEWIDKIAEIDARFPYKT